VSPALICAWFEHSMRWVLMTPLGLPVEPEVNRIFATVSGPTLACAASTASVGSVMARSANGVVERLPSGLAVTTISQSSGTAASMARANGRPSDANTKPGVRMSMIDLSLPKSLDMSEYGTEIGA
jgi:hypothetical protein